MPRLSKEKAKKKRHQRVRRKVQGTQERPRLCVRRSLKHIYAQLIDDEAGITVAAASTLSPELSDLAQGGNIEASKRVGQVLATRAQSAGVKRVVFDRSGYVYHGRIKALAEAAREGGLEF